MWWTPPVFTLIEHLCKFEKNWLHTTTKHCFTPTRVRRVFSHDVCLFSDDVHALQVSKYVLEPLYLSDWLFSPELSELPLVRLDVSCNRISHMPVCYRHLRHLQSIILDNNPLQMPPAQICSKGKFHIFKYLNMEACKRTQDQFEKALRPTAFNSWWEIIKDERS